MQTYSASDIKFNKEIIHCAGFQLSNCAYRTHLDSDRRGITINGYKKISNEYSSFQMMVKADVQTETMEKIYSMLNPVKDSKPILVFANPHSGLKKAIHYFEITLAPLLQEFDLKYELFVTSRPLEAQEYIERVENLASKYSGLGT